MAQDAENLTRAERKRLEQAAEMRRDIVEAAFAEFAERGYHQTAISDIAARLRVSHGTVYNYFAGKREILDHVVDSMLARSLEALQSDLPGTATTFEEFERQTLDIATSIAVVLDEDPRVVRMLFFELTAIDSAMTERMLGIFDMAGQVAAAYLQNGVDRGFLRADLDIPATADIVTGMAIATIVRALRQGKRASEVDDLRNALATLLIDGVRAR